MQAVQLPEVESTSERPQTRRAWELFREKGLTEDHLRAIRSAGVTDVGKARITQTGTDKNTAEVMRLAAEAKAVLGGYYREFLTNRQTTTGWQPSCACDADVVPCTVLDPFFGAGTTGLVADELGRDCIGIELNESYALMSEQRIRGAAPMFAAVERA